MASKKDKPKNHEERCKTEHKHIFTHEEHKEAGANLVRKFRDIALKEMEIKSTQAVGKAKLKQMTSERDELADIVEKGYSIVEVEATVEFNRKAGLKTFRHFAPRQPHNGEVIKVETMTEDDYAKLPLDGTEADPATGKPFNPVLEQSEANLAAAAAAETDPAAEGVEGDGTNGE